MHLSRRSSAEKYLCFTLTPTIELSLRILKIIEDTGRCLKLWEYIVHGRFQMRSLDHDRRCRSFPTVSAVYIFRCRIFGAEWPRNIIARMGVGTVHFQLRRCIAIPTLMDRSAVGAHSIRCRHQNLLYISPKANRLDGTPANFKGFDEKGGAEILSSRMCLTVVAARRGISVCIAARQAHWVQYRMHSVSLSVTS